MNEIMDLVNEHLIYVMIGTVVFSLVLFLFIIILLVKQHKLNKKYKKFMSGSKGDTLENVIIQRFTEIDQLKDEVQLMQGEIEKVSQNLKITVQKIGIVKYDAFKEMGGKLSYVLVLLDHNNNGILVNSVHSSREGCYTYLKEIIKGESFLELSNDEKKALSQAINSNNYLV